MMMMMMVNDIRNGEFNDNSMTVEQAEQWEIHTNGASIRKGISPDPQQLWSNCRGVVFGKNTVGMMGINVFWGISWDLRGDRDHQHVTTMRASYRGTQGNFKNIMGVANKKRWACLSGYKQQNCRNFDYQRINGICKRYTTKSNSMFFSAAGVR